MMGEGGAAERQRLKLLNCVICFWPLFLGINPDEWIGWVGRWIDGRVTGVKRLCLRRSFSLHSKAEGWTESKVLSLSFARLSPDLSVL